MDIKEIKLKHVYAVKLRDVYDIPDLIIGPNLDGSYDFNLRNIMFIGTDKKKQGYQLSPEGRIRPIEGLLFDEEQLIAEGPNLDEVLEKFDRIVKKHLVWSDSTSKKTEYALGYAEFHLADDLIRYCCSTRSSVIQVFLLVRAQRKNQIHFSDDQM